MIFTNQICIEPDYRSYLYYILSDYRTKKDYDNDINNFFNNFNIIFYTKTKPDSKYSNIHIGNQYYISMTIEEIRNLIEESPNDDFVNEIINKIVRYLPGIFFEDFSGLIPDIKISNHILAEPRYMPDNNEILVLDDFKQINYDIGEYMNIFTISELRHLFKITLKLHIPRFMIDKICEITNDKSVSMFILKNIENDISFFNKRPYNKSLSELNERKEYNTRRLFKLTEDKSYLSDDVMYCAVITRSIEDWSIIANELIYKPIYPDCFFGMDTLINKIRYYNNISKIFHWEG